jgi:hypothetical protein
MVDLQIVVNFSVGVAFRFQLLCVLVVFTTNEPYEHLNPMPFEAAARMEIEMAEDLRAERYTVTGGTYRGFESHLFRPHLIFHR